MGDRLRLLAASGEGDRERGTDQQCGPLRYALRDDWQELKFPARSAPGALRC